MTGWTQMLVRIVDPDDFERTVQMFPNIDVARIDEETYKLVLHGFRREDDVVGILERVQFFDALFVSADDTRNAAQAVGITGKGGFEVRQEAYCVSDERHNFSYEYNGLELDGERPDTDDMIHAELLEPEPSESMKDAEIDFIQEAEQQPDE